MAHPFTFPPTGTVMSPVLLLLEPYQFSQEQKRIVRDLSGKMIHTANLFCLVPQVRARLIPMYGPVSFPCMDPSHSHVWTRLIPVCGPITFLHCSDASIYSCRILATFHLFYRVIHLPLPCFLARVGSEFQAHSDTGLPVHGHISI